MNKLLDRATVLEIESSNASLRLKETLAAALVSVIETKDQKGVLRLIALFNNSNITVTELLVLINAQWSENNELLSKL